MYDVNLCCNILLLFISLQFFIIYLMGSPIFILPFLAFIILVKMYFWSSYKQDLRGGGGGTFGTFYTTNSIRIYECQVESKIISSLHA